MPTVDFRHAWAMDLAARAGRAQVRSCGPTKCLDGVSTQWRSAVEAVDEDRVAEAFGGADVTAVEVAGGRAGLAALIGDEARAAVFGAGERVGTVGARHVVDRRVAGKQSARARRSAKFAWPESGAVTLASSLVGKPSSMQPFVVSSRLNPWRCMLPAQSGAMPELNRPGF